MADAPGKLKMMERRQRAAERRGWETASTAHEAAYSVTAPELESSALAEDLDVILFYKYVVINDVGTAPY